MKLRAESWSIFDGLAGPMLSRESTWTDFDVLQAAAQKALRPEIDEAQRLLDAWAERMKPLGLTPSDLEWTGFRPLRLGREEDWSDWLAFLIEEGPAALMYEFLGIDVERVKAKREVVAGEYRADIVLESGSSRISIEVKIDDTALEKTRGCCASLETSSKGSWRHFILFRDDRRDDWETLREEARRTEISEIASRTWGDLALALRRCLWREEGTVAWRAWACAYCGAVEQRILEVPSKSQLLSARSYSMLARVVRLCNYLGNSRENRNGGSR